MGHDRGLEHPERIRRASIMNPKPNPVAYTIQRTQKHLRHRWFPWGPLLCQGLADLGTWLFGCREAQCMGCPLQGQSMAWRGAQVGHGPGGDLHAQTSNGPRGTLIKISKKLHWRGGKELDDPTREKGGALSKQAMHKKAFGS